MAPQDQLSPVTARDATRRAMAAAGAAADYLRRTDERTLGEQAEISGIPSPPFGEEPRARRMATLMAESELDDVRIDEVGNVLGVRAGTTAQAPLVISAHLDTVFPAGTDTTVSRSGARLRGPGIADNARGLAALLALGRALAAGRVTTRAPLLFAATVGEEGIGDLRGVKHLFGTGGAGRDASGFISIDGAGLERVVVRGLGSRRFRVTASGPGGHSWTDWGAPNPIHALGRVVASLSSLTLPRSSPTTLTVARWGGGTSINAIPQHAWVEIDTRSESPGHLDELEGSVRAAVADEAAVTGGLRYEVAKIGDRPSGSTAADSTLVEAAVAATRAVGRSPTLSVSSTDANLPMSLGVPAVTLGAGGEAGQAHTTEEWYENRNGAEGLVRALYTVVLAAGVAR